ncbi:MAG: alpha/beta hydrolase [Acidimicrobiales bacterium]
MPVTSDEFVRGVRYRGFLIEGDSGPIPGALWSPAGEDPGSDRSEPLALVLIGHGASGSKQQDYVRSLGRRLAAKHGIAAAAIDGPVHGDRREDGGRDGRLTFLDFAKAWSSDAGMTDAMVADWKHVLDELSSLPGLGGRVGYWGLSMGTILGLPFVAAEARVEVAVLGLMGLTGPTRERLATDAPEVTCPLLFLVQWSDELFPRGLAIELFEALGSRDKRLHANPGRHGELPDEEIGYSAEFLVSRLTAAAGTRPAEQRIDGGVARGASPGPLA